MLKSYALYTIIAVIGAIQLIVLFSENGNLNKKDYGNSKEKKDSSLKNGTAVGNKRNGLNQTTVAWPKSKRYHGLQSNKVRTKYTNHSIHIGSKNIFQDQSTIAISSVALVEKNTTRKINGTTQSFPKHINRNSSSEINEGNLNITKVVALTKNQSIIDIDLVVKIQGELGNHIHAIALGKAMQFIAKEFKYPLRFKIHYLGQKGSAFKQRNKQMVGNDIKSCFPTLVHADFRECNEKSYNKIFSHQEHLFGNSASNLTVRDTITKGQSIKGMQGMFQFLMDSIREGRYVPFHQLQTILHDVNILPLNVPFLLANNFCYLELVDRYHEQIREFLNFNTSACCMLKPEPDETVIHIRGFATEMKKKKEVEPKYTEVNATTMANEVLKHLKKGDKVALLSRFAETLEPYKNALEERDLKVRIIAGQSVMSDFCFLMSTTKELVGMISSTYVFWASLLSYSVQKVTLYRTSIFAEVENRHMPKYPQFNDSLLNATFNFPIV